MKPGDYLLCYLTGISRWIAVLEVTSQPGTDTAPIWKDEDFPSRVHVRSVVTLTPRPPSPSLSCATNSASSGAEEPQRLDRIPIP